MDLRIPDILAHIRQQHLHLLQLPAQHRREQAEGEGFEAVFDLHEIEGADGFLFGVYEVGSSVSISLIPPPPLSLSLF